MSARRVLITGANGYIAAQTVARFLSAGWTVRGTVRDLSSSSTRALAAHFAAEQSKGLFELIAVPDIRVPGAFNSAVRDVNAIAHLATPVVFDSSDVEYIMGTAVDGTVGMLDSALKAEKENENSRLESFVLMSSVVAIRSRAVPPPVTFTEKDWNDAVVAQVKESGDKAFGHMIYQASKVESEHAFWNWVKEKKPKFKATALHPSWVAGPPAYLPSSPEGIADTNKFIYTLLSGGEYPEGPGPGYGTHVDVRDVARMVEWAASHPEVTGGQRYLVGGNGNNGVPQAAADILREAYPDRRDFIKAGTPGAGYLPGWAPDPNGSNVDSTKAIEATGQNWISYDKIILDTAKMFEAFL
ncbi:NAD(P)-binding protein [Xylariaceae sp. FL0255]|nr:NAD(P)-binding protein [Xylariaceae sp. FL0255]